MNTSLKCESQQEELFGHLQMGIVSVVSVQCRWTAVLAMGELQENCTPGGVFVLVYPHMNRYSGEW